MKKQNKVLGSYILCKQCSELGGTTCRVYLEDRQYMVQCIRCGYEGLLKEQHVDKHT